MSEEKSTNQNTNYQKVKDWREKNPESVNAIKQYNNRFRIVGYLPPRYASLFSNYVSYQEESESSCITQIVKKFFDALPEKERLKIQNFSKNSY
jgi:hypothetical protein